MNWIVAKIKWIMALFIAYLVRVRRTQGAA